MPVTKSKYCRGNTGVKSLLFLVCLLTVHAGNVHSGPVVPDWTLENPKGERINFYTDSRDHVSVLLFWATWCPYCRSLMPHLQTLAGEFSKDEVRFYALNIWEDGDPVGYIRDNGFTFALLLNADDVAKQYGVRGTPGLLVVDSKHQIRYLRAGGEDNTEVEVNIRNTLTNLLSGNIPGN